MGAAVAIIVRKQRDIVYVFQGARAMSPETARHPSELGIERDMIFNGLVRRAVLRETPDGRYYFDELSWRALGGTRRRAALVILSAVLLLVGFGFFLTASRW
jgi:hypothetical protein